MTNIRRALQAAAAVGEAGEDVEDVFSTYVYTGTEATLAIVNGIDFSGEGGMAWFKSRSSVRNHFLQDTINGGGNYISSSTTGAEASIGDTNTFNSDGFTLGANSNNNIAEDIVAWSFREAPGFFDIVTYTGDSVTGREIPHNLGSVPGCIIIKNISEARSWIVYHRSVGNADNLILDTTNSAQATAMFNYTTPTSTVFEVNNDGDVNATGSNYVAYLFAHDDQIFGAGSDESIIACGSYTGNGSGTSGGTPAGPQITLGWEPQYLMVKDTTSTNDWFVWDTIRGLPRIANSSASLNPNLSDAEVLEYGTALQATGFQLADNNAAINNSGSTYIYIAIRRPMKVPEAGTDVFGVDTRGRLNTDLPGFDTTFPRVDLAIINAISGGSFYTSTRLTGTGVVYTNTTAGEGTSSNAKFDYMNGWYSFAGTDADQISWMFNRAPEFMDVVCFTGTGASLNVDHGLTVAPELMLVKGRTTSAWNVYHSSLGPTKYLALNSDAAAVTSSIQWDDTAPTASVFTVDWGAAGTGDNMIAYLFATLAGISKVGGYTADATLTTINCGFSAGARFILIKRTDAAGDWYFWDYFRGIVAGNDPYMLLNDSAAEVTGTDYIDPENSGFQITAAGSSTINVDTGTYIFLAIA